MKRRIMLRKVTQLAAVAVRCSVFTFFAACALAQTAENALLKRDETQLNFSNTDGVLAGETPAAAPARAAAGKPQASSRERGQVGLGIRVSTLGPGAEVATSLAPKLNLRGGFNFFSYNRGFDKDGVAYKGQLHLRSGELHLDWYPFAHGFHLSPGLLVYNGNGATANASVPANGTFTLGGTDYLSDPKNPITGKGKLDFVKVAPTFLFGFGNLVPRSRHFSVNFDLGVVFQGSARTTLNLSGNACHPDGTNCVNAATDPTVQSRVQSEQGKVNNTLSPFKYYPVVSLGFGYKF